MLGYQQPKSSNILVIGDVHGCFNTFKSIVEQHWTEPDLLVQLGDLIDRGNFSGETIQFIRQLQQLHPHRVVVLRGNHEQELIEYVETESNKNWLRQRGHQTLANFLKAGVSLFEAAAWMKSLPLYWQNQHILISHAGISINTDCPFDADNRNGVLWTRQQLKNIGKVQVVGHTPTKSGQIEHDNRSNSWYIDTGACFGNRLSAIKLTSLGKAIETYQLETKAIDVSKIV